MDQKKFSKEIKSSTIKANVRDILNVYYHENNFQVFVKTIKDTLYVFVNGCELEKIRDILENFLNYKIKSAVRKVKEKKENKIIYKRVGYKDVVLVLNDECGKYFYYRYD